ncbi:MAG: ribonuclease E activity regulator RraA [Actinomycetota bacterium]
MNATTDISDAQPRAGVLDPILRHFGGRSHFEGPVRTVRTFEDNVLVVQALETIEPGEVLVVDAGGSLRCALVGDRLARIAVDRGIPGILVYGGVRDTAAIGSMDVGVMALTSHPRRSRKDGIGERDCPVTFGTVTFSPGDRLYADEDGVVVVPTALV